MMIMVPEKPAFDFGFCRKVAESATNILTRRRWYLALTQMDLGERIDLSYQQVHKYEAGINQMSLARFVQVCLAMNESPVLVLRDAIKGSSKTRHQLDALAAMKPTKAEESKIKRGMKIADQLEQLPDYQRKTVLAIIENLLELSTAPVTDLDEKDG